MQYFLLIAVIILTSSQSIFQKQYNLKTAAPNVFLFSALTSMTALVFFVLSSGFQLEFSPKLAPYSLGFGATYAATWVATVFAIRFGSMAITTLITSYSLIIPALYGIIFLKEPIGINVYIGMALLLISLLLLNLKGGQFKFSLKWLICVTVAFAGNGMCATVQKMQQLKFNGEYKNEFMIIALAAAAVILFLFALKQGGIKKDAAVCVRYAALNGTANGALNLLVMILTGLVPNAILFPSVSAGGIVLSFVIAVLIYKEKLTRMQAAGYILGVASVILLNL